MSSGSRKYTREQIERLTFGIESLDQSQREKVRHALLRLRDQKGGVLYEESTYQELLKLKNAGTISEIDLHGIHEALFAE